MLPVKSELGRSVAAEQHRLRKMSDVQKTKDAVVRGSKHVLCYVCGELGQVHNKKRYCGCSMGGSSEGRNALQFYIEMGWFDTCTLCKGSGRLEQGGDYCDCHHGSFLEGLEELQAQKEAGELDTGSCSGGGRASSEQLVPPSCSGERGQQNTEDKANGEPDCDKAAAVLGLCSICGEEEVNPEHTAPQPPCCNSCSWRGVFLDEYECCHGTKMPTEGDHFDSAGQCSDPGTWDEYRGYDSDA